MDLLERHEQSPRVAAKRLESVVAVKRGGAIVLGIDHQGEDGNF